MANKNYKQLKAQLEEIIGWFEGDDLDLDEAVKKYAQAQTYIAELQACLDQAKLQVKQMKKAK